MATIAELESRVVEALRRGAPGLEAQLLLAPRPRAGWRPGLSPDDARAAAGLLLLYPLAGDVALPLTVRAGVLRRHGGQISLPGGVVDDAEVPEAAALREATEEIGLDPASARVLGSLTPLDIPVSGFRLHPIVAVTDVRPDFVPAVDEVDRILEVPIAWLADPARLQRTVRFHNGEPIDVPYFDIDGHQVWGATAMVLAEFLWLVGMRTGLGRD